MGRFNVTQWCDFVRGVADPDAEREMRERLASGDAGAKRAVDVLSRVAAVSRTDQETGPPEYAVRMAKAIGSLQRPREEVPSSSIWSFLPFDVTFDSLREPALAGMRDMQTSFRQLSFASEGYTVDVRMDHGTEPRSTVVVGHVLRRPARPVADIPVLVTAGGKIVERSVTSEFGEFQADGLPREVELYVLVGSETCLRLPLEQGEAD